MLEIDKNEKKSKVDKKVEEKEVSLLGMLKNQLNDERFNEATYYDMALAADHLGLPEFAKFLYDWSNEEKVHSQMFANFILSTSNGTRPKICTIEIKPIESDCICDFVEAIYAVETTTTKRISKIHKKAISEDNFKVASFTNSFLKEQIEEEGIAMSLVKLWETCESSKIDFELGIKEIYKNKNSHKLGRLGNGAITY